MIWSRSIFLNDKKDRKIEDRKIERLTYQPFADMHIFNKEQAYKIKLKIWALKTTFLDPWKNAFLVFKEKPPLRAKILDLDF